MCKDLGALRDTGLVELTLENTNGNLFATLLITVSLTFSDLFLVFIVLGYSGLMIKNRLQNLIPSSDYSVYIEAWVQMRFCPSKIQLPASFSCHC